MVFKEENLDKIKVKIFIAALEDVKEELEILLNFLVEINKYNEFSNFNLKFVISGNTYVKSIINNKNFNLELFDSIDTFPYGENPVTDAFIGVLWNKTKDLNNFPKIDLKEDFSNAFKFLDFGGILYGSLFFTFKEASLFSSINV
ncbi:MAG: hypothetical protein LBU40_05335, partial [Methanobrevibacter sp.]|nr:hypothetical protein [Methanobrevibacter sp.]